MRSWHFLPRFFIVFVLRRPDSILLITRNFSESHKYTQRACFCHHHHRHTVDSRSRRIEHCLFNYFLLVALTTKLPISHWIIGWRLDSSQRLPTLTSIVHSLSTFRAVSLCRCATVSQFSENDVERTKEIKNKRVHYFLRMSRIYSNTLSKSSRYIKLAPKLKTNQK